VYARITPASGALEIGSGTGIATLPLAELGCSIHCLEHRRHSRPEPPARDGESWREHHPPDIDAGIADARASIERAGCFREVEFHRFPWQRSFRAEEYVRLLRTHSDHATLPAEVRERYGTGNETAKLVTQDDTAGPGRPALS
jgi:hypothetical protein